MEKTTKYFSTIQEHRVADYLSWGVVSGSGARACYPGDIESSQWLGECKTHVSPNQPIKFMKDVWVKLRNEATAKHKYPVLITDDGSQDITKTWCLFPYRLVAPDYSKYIEFSTKSKTNIIFNHIEGFDIWRNEKNTHQDRFIILTSNMDNSPVGIIPLVSFREVYGG